MKTEACSTNCQLLHACRGRGACCPKQDQRNARAKAAGHARNPGGKVRLADKREFQQLWTVAGPGAGGAQVWNIACSPFYSHLTFFRLPSSPLD